MSVSTLKGKKGVAWVDEKGFLPDEFGPPVFDETNLSYNWRGFKRGFTWGTLLSLNHL